MSTHSVETDGAGLRPRLSWLHTWCGISLLWLMYAVFVTGSFSFYDDELTVWMQPATHLAHPAGVAGPQRAMLRMAQVAPRAAQWKLSLPSERDPSLRVEWFQRPQERTQYSVVTTLDGASGETIAVRDTLGGGLLYRFHFQLVGIAWLWGRWIVGVATAAMLISLLTGIIIHKKYFKEFFTFRPDKGLRSWMDAHNALGVVAMPFHLVMTFSGLLLLTVELLPWGFAVHYGHDRMPYRAERAGFAYQPDAAPAPLNPAGFIATADVTPMLRAAAQVWGRAQVGEIDVENPGTAQAQIELVRRHGLSLLDGGYAQRLRFDGVSGAALGAGQPPQRSLPREIYNTLSALHIMRIADPGLRLLSFLSGVLGTAMIATGALLWVHKRALQGRKRSSTPWGEQLVARMNVAVFTGLLLAIGVYVLAGRCLPAPLAHRQALEQDAFLLAWSLAALHAALRPPARSWREQLAALVLLFATASGVELLHEHHGAPMSQAVMTINLIFVGLALVSLLTLVVLWQRGRRADRQLPTRRRTTVAA